MYIKGGQQMAKKPVYKITINGWEDYNSKSKPGHKCIFISKRFFDDTKIQRLPQGGKLLYLGLLLRRGDVKETFYEASHEDLVRLAGGSGQVVQRLMEQLQSLQLVSYEIFPLIEKKRKEEKRKEEKRIIHVQEPSGSAQPAVEPIPEKLFNLWNLYRDKLPEARRLNSQRSKMSAARWKEEPNEIYWISVIKKLNESAFCTGKNNTGWIATFDWFLKPDTHVKVMESKYDNRDHTRSRPMTSSEVNERSLQDLWDKVDSEGTVNEQPG